MSKDTVGREAVEIVHIQTPHCANKFGCAPCRAYHGNETDTSDLSVLFGPIGTGSDYVGNNATVTRIQGGINVAATATSSSLRATGVTSGVDGNTYRYVVIHGKINTVPTTLQWYLYYGTASLGFDAARRMQPLNLSTRWRGFTPNAITAGQEFVLVFDAADSTNYATDWQGEIIDRIDFVIGPEATVDFDIYSIVFCKDNLFASKGLECYNTRATCVDPANYRARPTGHLDADYIMGYNEIISYGEASPVINHSGNLVAAFDVMLTPTPSGTIWESGGGSTTGAHLGITGSNIVFRAGDSYADTAYTARVAVPYSSIAGFTITLIVEIDADASKVSLWWWCPCKMALTLLGTDTASTPWILAWAGSGPDTIGYQGATTPVVGEDGGVWNGLIKEARFYNGRLTDFLSSDVWSRNLYLSRGEKARPSDDIYIIPALNNSATVSTRINVAAADRDYEPLGRRATFDFSCEEFTHSDHFQDDYLEDRSYDPFTRGTFWSKWLRREKYGKVRALVRVYNGYTGEALSAMKKRLYQLEQVDWADNQAGFFCRDILTRTEFLKAQIPAPSPGKLFAAITNTDTEFKIEGDYTLDYTESGTVLIDNEIITYSNRVFDDVYTVFTVSQRGTDGSTADSHDALASIQACRRYTNARVDDVLIEWLVLDSHVESQFANLTNFTSVYDAALSAYTITTLITKPTSVQRLIGQLSMECAFHIWWDERTQKIDMQAIQPSETIDLVLTEENHILQDSFSIKEQPDERVTTIAFYYNPINWAENLEEPTNYKNLLAVVNATTSNLDQYGAAPQIREIFSRFLQTEAQANQTSSRFSIRFADVPQEIEFSLDAKDGDLWVGDFVRVSHRAIITATGERDEDRRWIVIEAEEKENGHSVRYIAADITLDGRLYVIAANGTADYASDTFLEGVAYITTNEGLNYDGTPGATIG